MLARASTGTERVSAVFKVKRSIVVVERSLLIVPFVSCLLHFHSKMRRTTLGTLNIGNQSRQVAREKKSSLGPRPSIGNRASLGRPSTSGRPSLANARSATGRYAKFKSSLKCLFVDLAMRLILHKSQLMILLFWSKNF